MNTENEQIARLELEVKQLNIRLETLINYLSLRRGFGPPSGRDPYDEMVKQELARANISQASISRSAG
jgi:hypothetical protein